MLGIGDNAPMPEPAAPDASAAAVRAPRRRRSPIAVLLAVALVLAGRGLGWFGGGGATATVPLTPADVGGAQVDPAPPPGAAPTDAPAPDPVSKLAAAVAHADGESPPLPVVPVPVPPPPAPAASGIDDDRFRSLLSLVAARRQQGELGGALAVLQRTAALPLDAAQRQLVQTSAQEVRAAVDVVCAEVRTALAGGEVLAANDRCRALLADGPDLVAPTLAAGLGLPAATLQRVPERTAQPWPVAAPLARDRVVRTRLADGPVTGRVVDGRSDQVTLRVETPHGVTFPTLAVVGVEPVDPSAAEAVELALAALQAGDALLARLWLCCAQSRGDLGAQPRAQRLQEILH